jgi:hypothetical protein
MTRDEVVSKVLGRQLVFFREIPEHLQDADLAKLWVNQSNGSLRDIPAHLIDDEVRLSAMTPTAGNRFTNSQNVVDSLSLIDPQHTERYEEIALNGVCSSPRAIWSVDFSFLNNSFFKKALDRNCNALLFLVNQPEKLERSKILIDQDVIDLAVSGSASYFGYFKNHQYRKGALRSCIKNNTFGYGDLVAIGRFDVLVDMVREGFWPINGPDLPENLESGIVDMLAGSHIHQAYVQTFPIKEVVDNMTTPIRKMELLKMYCAEELAAILKTTHLGQDRAFKAHILESGLGL